ncbi:MAG: amino acid ABC transporter permease [Thermacetogeniaceae bacterium]
MDAVFHNIPYLLVGAVTTLKISITAVCLGIILGLFAGMGRLSSNKLVSFLATCYVDFFRGTPLLVQIFIVYFGLPQLYGQAQTYLFTHFGIGHAVTTTQIGDFLAAIIAFSLNSGAYVGEIFRAGIQSIEKGQREAALSLGMTPSQSMRYVILPQAFRRVVPPLGNEFIAMLKDTALLTTIGVEELLRKGEILNSTYFKPFPIFISVAFIYLIMTLTFSRFVDYTERRLGVHGHNQG